jgi:aryl-alcohol dehydrogenase-like predicted oxidoreductase
LPEHGDKTLCLNALGNTGIQVSEIGLGTVKFGRNTDVKYPSQFKIPSHGELRALLNKAKHLGINYLDTAPAYGTSEETLGRLLAEDRSDWVISTKVGEYYDNQVSVFDFSREKTTQSIELSCQKLGLDHLDIVYVHSNGDDAEIIDNTDVLPTLTDLKQQGKIRAIGFSGKNVESSLLALSACDVFMITLNQADESQAGLIERCKQLNKGVVIKKALASGHSASPAEALRFVNQYPGVSSAIIGTINPDHLVSNVKAVTGA